MKADKERMEKLLKTARGQLDGILKMIDQDRYCIDIVNQLMATQSILRRASREILNLVDRLVAAMGRDKIETLIPLLHQVVDTFDMIQQQEV